MAPTPKNSGPRKCGMQCEVYSRVCGYHRPTRLWNKGKQEEFKDRTMFDPEHSSEPKQTRELIAS
jgi:hypothetical protein